MAYVNLPPNLQDMFYNLSDRIAKLETGPNMPMVWAQSAQSTAQSAQFMAATAQSVATTAQIQAINAGVQANIAQSQATVAQSTATFAQSLGYAASAQATVAQTTANGKNKITYSLSVPGTTANTAGDLWWQYNGAGFLIGQYVGLGGTSWQQQTITQAVIGVLDAGKITTGTLNAITINAGSGGQYFNVTAAGYMSAQGAYIKGNITADSGTFTGSIYANTGYFGQGSGPTLFNGWQINSTGITGVGTATITGGAINGAIITGGTVQTSAGSNAVVMNGASNAFQIRANGSIVANILNQSTSASIWHYGGTPDSTGSTYPKIVVSSTSSTIYGGVSAYFSANAVGNSIVGSTTVNDTTTFVSTVTANSDVNLSSISELRVPFAYNNTTTNAATVWISSTGQLRRSTASSQRYKTDIVNLKDVAELDPTALYNLPVRAFKFKPEYLAESDDRANVFVPGFIAEEVDTIYPIAADYLNNAESWNDRMIIPAMLALIQEQNERIKILEAK